MVRSSFLTNIIKIILYISVSVESKLRNHKTVLLSWEENYNIKELTVDDVPEDCRKNYICSNITTYETEFVNNLLKKLSSQKNLKKFNVDKLTVLNSYGLGEIEELCASKEEIIWPQAAVDDKDQWQYIVNTGVFPFQGYRINRCIERGSRCSKAAIFDGFNSSCEQEIFLRKMVYIDVKNKQLATNYFQIPSCCSCKITSIDLY
ncbi:uncharacterized protein LOC116766943 [Danaus plexippus]|uniref:uncharacterized protein LOC116766943 n=1 Tax=Danaus plexippus TaxID=13037 RepID=UPI002AB22D30|nr:uncharacterized protein LOC116766943 [Danaus plexippus]XP_061377555.1 uncharacterized protein LOC116766943 [Danaus plexippus]